MTSPHTKTNDLVNEFKRLQTENQKLLELYHLAEKNRSAAELELHNSKKNAEGWKVIAVEVLKQNQELQHQITDMRGVDVCTAHMNNA